MNQAGMRGIGTMDNGGTVKYQRTLLARCHRLEPGPLLNPDLHLDNRITERQIKPELAGNSSHTLYQYLPGLLVMNTMSCSTPTPYALILSIEIQATETGHTEVRFTQLRSSQAPTGVDTRGVRFKGGGHSRR